MTVIQQDSDIDRFPSMTTADTVKLTASSGGSRTPPLLDVPLDIAFEVRKIITLRHNETLPQN